MLNLFNLFLITKNTKYRTLIFAIHAGKPAHNGPGACSAIDCVCLILTVFVPLTVIGMPDWGIEIPQKKMTNLDSIGISAFFPICKIFTKSVKSYWNLKHFGTESHSWLIEWNCSELVFDVIFVFEKKKSPQRVCLFDICCCVIVNVNVSKEHYNCIGVNLMDGMDEAWGAD